MSDGDIDELMTLLIVIGMFASDDDECLYCYVYQSYYEIWCYFYKLMTLLIVIDMCASDGYIVLHINRMIEYDVTSMN